MNYFITFSLLETIMGISIKAQENENSEYVRCVKEMGNLFMERAISIWKRNDLLYMLSPSYWKERRTLEILHQTTLNVIKQRRSMLFNKNDSAVEKQNEFGFKKKIAFLDILLQAVVDGESLSDTDIKEEVDTFMFEVSNILNHFFLFLEYTFLKKIFPIYEKNITFIKVVFKVIFFSSLLS